MLAPYKGRVYDPCCGPAAFFVSSEKFIESIAAGIGDISILRPGEQLHHLRLAKMNSPIRGIDAQIKHGDTFHNDRHPDLKPTTSSPPAVQRQRLARATAEERPALAFGVRPPATPTTPGCTLPPSPRANRRRGLRPRQRSMSSSQSGEGEIRKAIIEADLGGLHGRAPRPALLLDTDFRSALVPRR